MKVGPIPPKSDLDRASIGPLSVTAQATRAKIARERATIFVRVGKRALDELHFFALSRRVHPKREKRLPLREKFRSFCEKFHPIWMNRRSSSVGVRSIRRSARIAERSLCSRWAAL
jgi:hypothetical protein